MGKDKLRDFLIFPGVAMMLGWGLRGYIGGGPFGALIPGVLVSLAIAQLLRLKSEYSSIAIVFGMVGVGLGGEMTYGQTLGFLRNADTVLWGTTGTTVKGAVWGLCSGAFLAIGLIWNRIPLRVLIISLGLFSIGLIMGFILINDPKLIYFSDPINKPRSESWAGLLFGTIFLLTYLYFRVEKDNFKIIRGFSLIGLVAGGLGFGLGGLWLFIGSQFPEIVFDSWWKLMEFSFGLLLGIGLGYASWRFRQTFKLEGTIQNRRFALSKNVEIFSGVGLSIIIYFLYPSIVEPFSDHLVQSGFSIFQFLGAISRILINFTFYGCMIILLALWKKELAWQIAVTLTFCHTMVDWTRDLRPTPETHLSLPIQVTAILICTTIVAALVSTFRRKNNVNDHMMQILIWSTVLVAFLSLASDIFIEDRFQSTDLAYILLKTLFVHFVFLGSAVYVSKFSFKINSRT